MTGQLAPRKLIGRDVELELICAALADVAQHNRRCWWSAEMPASASRP